MPARLSIVGILYHSVVALAIIFFASPIFRILGFEYSSLIALASSLWVMLFASNAAYRQKKISRSLIGSICSESAMYGLIPFVISLCSAIFIPNCALVDGMLFYLQIVPLSIGIAILLGIGIGLSSRSVRSRRFIVISAWIGWLILSLLPGYFTPQLFTYGWQYGYFPGLVWDEYIELHQAYWVSRFIFIVAATTPLFFIGSKRSVLKSLGIALFPMIVVMILIAIEILAFPSAGIVQTSGIVESELSATEQFDDVRLHFKRSSLTSEELLFLKSEIHIDIDSVRALYQMPISSFHTIDIYLYPSVAELFKYVGTRSASISKPWRGELHIAKENMRSLKHELTHVLLAPYGSWPFLVSYSTGLTEGAAESAAPEFDGIRTINDAAADIIELNLASGIGDVMNFTGFASNASAKSYVLAGSFSSYLINHYGAKSYREVYRSLDYESSFLKTFSQLETEWLDDLKSNRLLSDGDSLRTMFYFARKSIINEPCLRRIGKLLHSARLEFSQKQYEKSAEQYRVVALESHRSEAIQGWVFSLIRLGKYSKAIEVLDSTSTSNTMSQISTHLLRGDILFMIDTTGTRAKPEWEQAATLQLSAEQFMNTYSRMQLLSFNNSIIIRDWLIEVYRGDSTYLQDSLLRSIGGPADEKELQPVSINYFLARTAIIRGELRMAEQYLRECIRQLTAIPALDTDQKLFLRLINEKYEKLYRVFHTN